MKERDEVVPLVSAAGALAFSSSSSDLVAPPLRAYWPLPFLLWGAARFAPAFTEAVKLLSSLGRINFARVHDVIGQNKLIIDKVAEVVRPQDFPSGAMARRRARGRGDAHHSDS